MKFTPLILLILFAVTGSSFTGTLHTSPAARKITVVFHNQVSGKDLVLGDSVKTSVGETITVERFRYYVSNFSVQLEDGKTQKLPAEYFLVDEENPATKTITLTVPEGKIVRLGFLLGVDSIRNVSGVQTGALDPMKGMFWTWNSGYVMAKIEGTSGSSSSAGNRFTYHVGGFRTGMNVLKTIDIDLRAAGSAVSEIHINADIDRWFKGNTELKIAETPVCHSPGALAMRIADNYSTMFSLNSVK